MTQNTNPGGTSNVQSAGRDMMGVNASGTQTFRDINAYTQDLDQAGAAIGGDLRNALIEARDQIAKAEINDALKPVLIQNFDNMTAELKKGDKKDAGLASGLWSMVYGGIKAIPAAVGCYAALEKLKGLLGY